MSVAECRLQVMSQMLLRSAQGDAATCSALTVNFFNHQDEEGSSDSDEDQEDPADTEKEEIRKGRILKKLFMTVMQTVINFHFHSPEGVETPAMLEQGLSPEELEELQEALRQLDSEVTWDEMELAAKNTCKLYAKVTDAAGSDSD